MSDFIIRHRKDHSAVEIWSTLRLPLGNSDLRTAVQRELAALSATEGDILHCMLGTGLEPRENWDLENILFYNVEPGRFARLARRGVRFERALSHPVPPEPLPSDKLYYRRYALASPTATFASWTPGRALASWRDVPIPAPASSAAYTSHVWHAMVTHDSVTIVLPDTPITDFGLAISVSPPSGAPNLNAVAIVKSLLDGVIAAFHTYVGPAAILASVSQRVGSLLDLHAD